MRDSNVISRSVRQPPNHDTGHDRGLQRQRRSKHAFDVSDLNIVHRHAPVRACDLLPDIVERRSMDRLQILDPSQRPRNLSDRHLVHSVTRQRFASA